MNFRLSDVFCYLVVVIVIAACSQSSNGHAAAGKDSVRTGAGTSDAFNNLKNSEHYENVERINAKIIRQSTEKFSHTAKNGSDTILVRSKKPSSQGASLSVQFEVVEHQAINLSLKVSYIGKNCLFPEKYKLRVDHQSYDLIPSNLNRSKEINCIESADIQDLHPALMEAVSHASSVVIEFHHAQSIVSRKLPGKTIRDCREAYEYYLALGGKF